MNDQAHHLRQLIENRNDNKTRETKVISVISGKGGVGKSNISLNLALTLAEQGKKVLLFDLDIGMANLDILLGISTPLHVVDLIDREQSIWDIIVDGPLGLKVVTGGSGLNELFSMDTAKQERFSKQMDMLDGAFDFILFDMGAGANADSLQFILSSHETFLITTPEPTSITDAYAMLKYIAMKDPDMPSSVIINRVDSYKEGNRTADNIKRAASRFLNKDIHVLGMIPQDKHVLKAVKSQTPFYIAYPSSPAAKALKKCTASFTGTNDPVSHGERGGERFLHKLKRFMKKGGYRT